MGYKGKLIGLDEEIQKYYDMEMSDTKIGEKFSVSAESIRNWRINRKLPPIAKKKAGLGNLKFSTIIQSEFEKLYYQGMNDPKIAKILGVSPYTMFRYRTTLGLPTVDRYRRLELTDFQHQVLIGHLIGDGNLTLQNTNAWGKMEQSVVQKEYFMWKFEIFGNLTNGKISYTDRFSEWRQKNYQSMVTYLPTHPLLTELYHKLYFNGKKELRKEFLKDFGDVSLATLFMDDGYKYNRGYAICTNCFDDESLLEFKNLLYYKFGMESSHNSERVTYILKKESRDKFKKIVEPYIIPSMRYKLQED